MAIPTAGNLKLDEKSILITGGTNLLGEKFVAHILENFEPNQLVVLSTDELELHNLQQKFSTREYPCLQYIIGGVRDRDVLNRAFKGIDIVIHTEFLHLAYVVEYNPFEAVKTNIQGAANIVDMAIDRKVEKVISISTVSASNPGMLAGLAERTSEKLFVAGNNYSGHDGTHFSVVRIGSVFGSKENIVAKFMNMNKAGTLSISDSRRSRFWMTYVDVVNFVIFSIEQMTKGEVFIPKLPSIREVDLARAIAPDREIKVSGLDPSENIHEVLLSEDDSQFALEYESYYSIVPFYLDIGRMIYLGPTHGVPCYDGFRYSSDTNKNWLSVENLKDILGLNY
ncbi:MAG: polysaccharide biosynthesis protein [Anaerolineales bacterium]|nr:polysaccharide biosynthesis protein [Chloroflexota bacterium]MBL6980163.1 polysaccharide biosynthesis protein [Anaerolineales bacterium]